MHRWPRLAAGIPLLGGALLAAREIRVEWMGSFAASLRHAVEGEQSRRIFPAASARRLLQLAELDEAGRLRWLQAAVEASPRASEAWIALGLEYERRWRMPEAEQALLEAARIDHQHLPAWTLANYYFRRNARPQFWKWAARAAALTYDDHRPLIRLAAQFESDAKTLLACLEAGPGLTRAYLDFLIGQGRLDAASEAARVLEGFGDPSDRKRLEALKERQRASGQRRF